MLGGILGTAAASAGEWLALCWRGCFVFKLTAGIDEDS